MKHQWKGQQQGGNPAEIESYEWVCYCDNCGVEMDGDNEDAECGDRCKVHEFNTADGKTECVHCGYVDWSEDD